MVPTDSLKDYGELILLGAREADANGAVALKKISATATPTRIGGFTLAGSAFEALPGVAASTAAATLVGLVALFMPSSLGDSALYNCARSNRPAPAYACESNKRPPSYSLHSPHLGEFDIQTGEQTGKAQPERRTTTK